MIFLRNEQDLVLGVDATRKFNIKGMFMFILAVALVMFAIGAMAKTEASNVGDLKTVGDNLTKSFDVLLAFLRTYIAPMLGIAGFIMAGFSLKGQNYKAALVRLLITGGVVLVCIFPKTISSAIMSFM